MRTILSKRKKLDQQRSEVVDERVRRTVELNH